MNKAFSLIIGALLISSMAIAQDPNTKSTNSPPIPVEVMFGNNRFVSQFSINKKFAENSRLGFLAMAYIAADYQNVMSENESMNVLFISCEVLKGFGVVSGAALNSTWGFRPYAGLHYHYASQQFFAMVISGFYLTESYNYETIGVIEYRPHLKDNWSLYSRLEGSYNLDMTTKLHDRSLIYGRLGTSYKTYSFGFAVNYDWYGPLRVEKENFGVFLRKAFR